MSDTLIELGIYSPSSLCFYTKDQNIVKWKLLNV
jgi:hypothetical protein